MIMTQLIPILFVFILLQGCDRNGIYTYTEVHAPPETDTLMKSAKLASDGRDMPGMESPQIQAMVQNSATETALSWDTPQGWKAVPASGIRLATLVPKDSSSVECSIVSLSGPAGGIEANVARWLGQMGVSNLTDNDISSLIDDSRKVALKGGAQAQIIDLTDFSPEENNSIIGAVIVTGKSTVFIKMTGPAADLETHYPEFVNLVKSVNF